MTHQGPDGKRLDKASLEELLSGLVSKKEEHFCNGVLRHAQEIWQERRADDDVAMAALHWFHATNPQKKSDESAS